MDIPNLEELEFLEADSHLYDEDNFREDLQQPDPEPEPEPESESESKSKSPAQNHKRRRSNSPDSLNQAIDVQSDEEDESKRSKIDNVDVENEDDEDWLRYSPPPGPTPSAPLPQQQQHQDEVEVEEITLSRYAFKIDGEIIPVTAPSGGDRVYAKVCREEESLKKVSYKPQSKDLISEPVSVLLQKNDHEAFTKALRASSDDQTDTTFPQEQVVHEQLWVDKYAPSSFTELLSDEQTNREVLMWLKQWDSNVFGSEIRSTSDDVLSALKRHSSVSQHRKLSDLDSLRKNGSHNWRSGSSGLSYNSKYENSGLKGIQDLSNKKSRFTGLPEQKILLLCGSPGLGKTTLAHVAAKHCGYHDLEVNASDDRSSSSIEAKILDVVQMNSVMPDAKPKCLVIDEIDGSLGEGKGAVDVILKMVSAEKKQDIEKENVSKEGQTDKKSSKKGRKTSSLSRPVICICNDLYSPALRRLRQVAKVHIFVQPSTSRVVSRLKHICNREGMKTSSVALTALAEYTECDIRSCLNTLQFLNKKKASLNVLDISSQVVGRKDMSKGVYDIWKEIFQKRKAKERKHNNSASVSSEFETLYSLISNRGDYDLIFDGIHENILHLSYHDPGMQKTVKCLNSLGTSDLMHQYIMRTQQMPIFVYLPPLSIIIHNQIAQVQRPNIEWPKSYQRCRTTFIEKMEVFKLWRNKITPYISRHLSAKSFLEDSISLILHILSPTTLRPVALHLLSEKEKNDLAQLVSTMVSYSLTYKNMKSGALSSEFGHGSIADLTELSFDPPLSEFINFKGYVSCHRVLSVAMKQVLLHEVEKQNILQVGSGKVGPSDGRNKENQQEIGKQTSGRQPFKVDHSATLTGTSSRPSNPSICTNSSASNATGATASAKLSSTGITKKRPTGPYSFFDRFRKTKSEGSDGPDEAVQKATLERDSRPLLFKFNEGFTNAVKRPVRMREFLD